MSQNLQAADIIALLDLQPLEGEGGFFRQTHVKSEAGLSTTAIYYLVTPDTFSTLHRLNGDELFHFYLGDTCEMVTFTDAEDVTVTLLGQDVSHGEVVQHLVPSGTWQGTRLRSGGAFALMGTTMTPGYDPDGFESATEALLDTLDHDKADLLRPYLHAALEP